MEDSEHDLLIAWGLRLEIVSPSEAQSKQRGLEERETGVDFSTNLFAVGLGILWVAFAAGGPPIPIPGVSTSLFWLAWAPSAAILFLIQLGRSASAVARRRYWRIGGALALLVAIVALVSRGRVDDASNMAALHIPLVSIAAVVIATSGWRRHLDRYRAGLWALEVSLTACIYAAGAALLGALIVALFTIVQVDVPDTVIWSLGAFTLGAVAVVAFGNTPERRRVFSDVSLDWGAMRILTGFARIGIFATVMTLGIYTTGFLPFNFHVVLGDRSLLLAYTGTVAFSLVILACSLVGAKQLSRESKVWLRRGILALLGLALVVNACALVGTVPRLWDSFGITPNRHAVVGWNLLTFLTLSDLLLGAIAVKKGDFFSRVRERLGGWILPAGLWSAWVAMVSALL